jgi:hypothetical protein
MKHLKKINNYLNESNYNFYDEIDNIDYSNFNINNIDNRNMFDYIYSYAPDTIKEYIDSLKNIDQRRDYHPEGDVYTHTKVVTNRLSNTKDINLILSGFLHDTGKDRTLKIENDIIMHPGHEYYSKQLLDIGSPWREWIKNLGGNPDLIKFIIKNHMMLKYIKGSSKIKKWFNNLDDIKKYYLIEFEKCDKGGF